MSIMHMIYKFNSARMRYTIITTRAADYTAMNDIHHVLLCVL